ncbi:hypothetical protein BJ684DRAFT_21126 [Piptocephalis cylindrospora]|uniref:Exportin-5 C-terminal domain-containing protein n=1 Tax=Piptocephalis cylindrospora TaxID=1907219 RepID=A0A4P9Y0R6_9FUNG|nr:hypothetical protein BJ684DRAFT_21126 [Piptocephalis cylindrospora]|eukprot:RKP12327.1 hypothetical protein BJ684DRAFT_21126 [Piptocephalis cylindrospora]
MPSYLEHNGIPVDTLQWALNHLQWLLEHYAKEGGGERESIQLESGISLVESLVQGLKGKVDLVASPLTSLLDRFISLTIKAGDVECTLRQVSLISLLVDTMGKERLTEIHVQAIFHKAMSSWSTFQGEGKGVPDIRKNGIRAVIRLAKQTPQFLLAHYAEIERMVMEHMSNGSTSPDELILYQQFLLTLGMEQKGDQAILKGAITQILQGWSQPLWDSCLSELSSFGQTFGLYEGASAEQLQFRRKFTLQLRSVMTAIKLIGDEPLAIEVVPMIMPHLLLIIRVIHELYASSEPGLQIWKTLCDNERYVYSGGQIERDDNSKSSAVESGKMWLNSTREQAYTLIGELGRIRPFIYTEQAGGHEALRTSLLWNIGSLACRHWKVFVDSAFRPLLLHCPPSSYEAMWGYGTGLGAEAGGESLLGSLFTILGRSIQAGWDKAVARGLRFGNKDDGAWGQKDEGPDRLSAIWEKGGKEMDEVIEEKIIRDLARVVAKTLVMITECGQAGSTEAQVAPMTQFLFQARSVKDATLRILSMLLGLEDTTTCVRSINALNRGMDILFVTGVGNPPPSVDNMLTAAIGHDILQVLLKTYVEGHHQERGALLVPPLARIFHEASSPHRQRMDNGVFRDTVTQTLGLTGSIPPADAMAFYETIEPLSDKARVKHVREFLKVKGLTPGSLGATPGGLGRKGDKKKRTFTAEAPVRVMAGMNDKSHGNLLSKSDASDMEDGGALSNLFSG